MLFIGTINTLYPSVLAMDTLDNYSMEVKAKVAASFTLSSREPFIMFCVRIQHITGDVLSRPTRCFYFAL